MLRKIVAAVVLIPLVVILVGLAVANRQIVTLSFDPFDSTQPAASITLPLFGIVFIVLIAGVFIGGVASWLRQSQWRRRARHLDAEVRSLQEEVVALRHRTTYFEPPPEQRAEPSEPAKQPLILPPTP